MVMSRIARIKILPTVLLMLLGPGVVSCSSGARVSDTLYYPQAFASMQRLLVTPLENLTSFPEAGLIVSDLIAEELRAWHGYDVRDRHGIEMIARGGGEALPLQWNRGQAIKFGKLLEADAVMFGTILEFGYLREHRGLTELATFAVVVKIVSAESGRLLWSGTMMGTGSSGLASGRPPLMDVSSNAVQRALEQLFAQYEKSRSGKR